MYICWCTNVVSFPIENCKELMLSGLEKQIKSLARPTEARDYQIGK